jgi:hypothetical protein
LSCLIVKADIEYVLYEVRVDIKKSMNEVEFSGCGKLKDERAAEQRNL